MRAWLLPTAICLLAIAIVFRHTIASQFGVAFGDRGDSIIALSIFEHWRNVFAGQEVWNNPIYFHPYGDTSGYNDGYLLHGVLYALFRTGSDAFTADTLVSVAYKAIGFGSTYVLTKRVLGWERSAALLAALIFALSNNLFVRAGATQVSTLSLLPVVAIFAIGAFQHEFAGRYRQARLSAVAAALALNLWLMTAFYFAWFVIYFCIVFALCWIFLRGRKRIGEAAAELWRHRVTLAFFAGTFLIACIPFLLVYLPKMAETGGHPYRIIYLMRPTDLINVGPGNLVWGWLGGVTGAMDGEHETGFPLIFFGLACMAMWTQIRAKPRDPLLCAFALAVLVSWFLTLRIGTISLWVLVHSLVPGASGLRVVLRYQLFLVLPLLILIGVTYRARFAALLQNRPVVAAALVVLLVAEQVNLGGQTRFRRSEVAELDAIPAPPAGCRSFYVVTARRAEPMFISPLLNDLYPHNVDAMYLAGRWRVPTINGFSTFNPPDWNFAKPFAPDYEARIAAYASAHRLDGLCRLDMRQTQPWSLPPRVQRSSGPMQQNRPLRFACARRPSGR